ncbi:alpha-1,2-mannosyltransferase ALG9-like [Ornithodoros turicata]|uniref:Mannosyltransferase n=1 Tax=Ornithodoros turicata TaxID=34597 RepID=A0A2R5LI46_9ACAR
MVRQRRKELKELPRRQTALMPPPQRKVDRPTESTYADPWAPKPYTAFKALLSARLCAAVWSNISDCDETYNYWEPTHFLMYGEGMQTWEYSPAYAIRSYAYLWLHALPGLFYSSLLQSNRVLVFYFMRCILGFVCSLCEVYFYKGVLHCFGANVARIMLVLMLFSTGMFISSTAFLPSTFSMYAVLVSFGAWFLDEHRITVFSTAMGSLFGWPFSAILGLPAAYDIVVLRRKSFKFLTWSAISLVILIPPLLLIDTHYYGRLVLAPLNIVMYNVFSKQGANLYGIEPFSFYFKNATLNFNLAFPAALLSAPVLVLTWLWKLHRRHFLLETLALYIWCAIFFTQAHKEERFLFPIYPLICLCAALSVDRVQLTLQHIFGKNTRIISSTWVHFLIFSILLSVSRTVALYRHFRAPMEIYMELGPLANRDDNHSVKTPVLLCVGKEWYRFPSSFFLPEGWSLGFLESEFRGQLPKPYSSAKNATRIIPEHMNDANVEERSRYVNISQCNFLVDTDTPDETEKEPNYSRLPEWTRVSSVQFLDSKRSPLHGRMFYIPFLTDEWCSYNSYNLLQRLTKAKKV